MTRVNTSFSLSLLYGDNYLTLFSTLIKLFSEYLYIIIVLSEVCIKEQGTEKNIWT